MLALLWAMPVAAAPADCPQPRFTQSAPAEFLVLENPVLPTSRHMTRARRLYEGSGRAVSCATCHGRRGDGMGVLASQFNPPPRNFACARTVTDIPDGQLFWIIRYGSPDTAMPAHPDYSDDDIWLLVS
ncbi:MAG: cytochrome c, partial [Moraxellaceae bacterium]|nr:cytochrome c [Moraxellaceae bacterium]